MIADLKPGSTRTTWPMKTVLFLILAAGFVIRLWGLEMEGGRGTYNYDEANLYLSWARYFYQGGLNPHDITTSRHDICYPFFAQYLIAVAGWIFTGLKCAWASLAHLTMIRPSSIPAYLTKGELLLTGRLLQIALSLGLVYLCYRLGLVLLGRAEALVGALFVAVAPQLINHSRYLQSDTTVTFFVTLAVLFSSYLLIHGTRKWYLLAGLAAGLAVGSKHNGAVVFIAVLGAHFLRAREGRKIGSPRVRHLDLLWAFLMFVAGVGVSYPILWLDPAAFRNSFPYWYSHQLVSDKLETVHGSFWHHRWLNLYRFLAEGADQKVGTGPWILLLAGFGVVKAIRARGRNELFLLLFPLAYFGFVIYFRANVRHKDFLPLIVFLGLLAASGAAALVGLLRLRGWPRAALLGGLAILISLPSIVSDVKVAYCCWQEDTHQLGERWILENIPPGSAIAHEKYSPHISETRFNEGWKPRYLFQAPLKRYLAESVDYLISSSLAYERFLIPFDTYYNEKVEDYYRALDERFWVKTFRIDQAGYVDPVIKIYNLRREGPEWEYKSLILRDLEFDYSDESPPIMTLEKNLEYEGKSGLVVDGGQKIDKLLIAPERLSEISLLIHPSRTGSVFRGKVGGRKDILAFEEPQSRIVTFPARLGFPFFRYSYSVQVKSLSGDPFLVKIMTSPYQLARQYFLAGASDKAGLYLAAAAPTAPFLARLAGEDFDQAFASIFGESASWWREKYRRVYEGEASLHQIGKLERDVSASGDKAWMYRPGRDEPGFLVFGPYLRLPPQPWIASFRLKAEGNGGAEAIATVDVFSEGKILASRELRGADFPETGRYSRFDLPFVNDRFANVLEFRVRAEGTSALGCDWVEVYPDLAAWFRSYPPSDQAGKARSDDDPGNQRSE